MNKVIEILLYLFFLNIETNKYKLEKARNKLKIKNAFLLKDMDLNFLETEEQSKAFFIELKKITEKELNNEKISFEKIQKILVGGKNNE